MTEQQQLATIRDTAARAKDEGLHISEGAIRSWVSTGKLAFVPIGNRKYIYWPTLIKFLETGTKVDTTPRPRYGRGSRGGKIY